MGDERRAKSEHAAGKNRSKSGWEDPSSHQRAASPFSALASLRSTVPEGDSPPPALDATSAPPAAAPLRAVVRLERKGRGGKTVTRVTHLELDDATASAWCSEMKRALGCGAAVESGELVFQGDQRERVAALLRERGVARVSN